MVDARLADQVTRVSRRFHDLESALLEDADDTLAHDGLILANQDPDPRRLSHAIKLRDSRGQANNCPPPSAARRTQPGTVGRCGVVHGASGTPNVRPELRSPGTNLVLTGRSP